MTTEIKVGTPRKPMYCRDCGNCDCPNVSADAYWTTCPATQRKPGAADARLRELVASVRRYRNAPGVLFGTPSTLAEICRLLGFKNRCERGRVYLTPTKIQRLGLPLTDADAPGFAPRKEATPTT